MDEERWLRELAETGAICETCGGIHLISIEVAILAIDADLPGCECVECRPCEKLRNALGPLAEADAKGSSGEAPVA
jgi:hypothetical protein